MTEEPKEVVDVHEYVKERCLKVLEQFQSCSNNQATYFQIKSSLWCVLEDLAAQGLFVNVGTGLKPCADVNDIEEEKYLLDKYHRLYSQRETESPFLDENSEVDLELQKVTMRLAGIRHKRKNQDPTQIDVAFKHPETFEPWVWL